MSLHHGSKIVTDGLVFAYDMNPIENGRAIGKSWKGAPSFNASLKDGQDGTNPWGGDGSPTNLGIVDDVKFRGRKVAKFLTGTSQNCYINGTFDLSSSTNSTSWTSTIYFKRVDGLPVPNAIGMYQYVANNSNTNATIYPTEVEDGWYRAVYTRTGLTAGYPALTGMYGLGVGVEYYFADWQCESSPVPTPWFSGTRSNTEALIDWVGGNVITASSLTYNDDGSFSFNNSNANYIALPSDIGYSGNNMSAFAWFKSNGSPSGGYHIIFGGQELEISIPTSDALRVGIYSGTRYVSNHGSGLLDGNWHYIGFTTDGSTKTAYIDGVEVGTQAVAGTLTTSFSNRVIGRFGSSGTYYSNADITACYVYNKTLSAAEVKQNFNAMRGRYET